MFSLGTGTKTLQIPRFWLPEARNIANTVVLGFRGAENIGLYHDFCSDGFKNMRKHRLAIFRGPQKCENKLCCKNNSNNNKKKNKKNKHKNSTKRCGKMVTSCTRTSHCALRLRARAKHMNNTNAHTTIHNPHGIACVRSSTIIYIYIHMFIFTYIELIKVL